MPIRRVRRFLGVVAIAALAACASGKSNMGDGGDPPDAGQLGPTFDAAPRPDAADVGGGGGPVSLTQSTSMTVAELNSVACGNDFFTTESSYYRVFDLPAGGVTGAVTISNVSVGIETALSGGGVSQPATVKLHTLSGSMPTTTFNRTSLTQIGTAEVTVADQDLAVLQVPVSANVPAGSKLVVEFFVPDGEADENTLYVGTNDAGETGPTFVRDGCGGADEPTTLGSLGVDGVHWVLEVSGEEQ